MGQREVVLAVGAGTVRMGRREVEDRGGEGCLAGVYDEGGCMVGAVGLARETVFVEGGLDDECVEEALDRFWGGAGGAALLGRPEMMGGGRSRPSAALRESWRAKSEACHHSRNLSAKMEVGRRIFRLDSRRG